MITPTKNLVLSLISVAIIGLVAAPSLKQTQAGPAYVKAKTAVKYVSPALEQSKIVPAEAQKSDVHWSPATGDGSN